MPDLFTLEVAGWMNTLGSDVVKRQIVEASSDQISGYRSADAGRARPACIFAEATPTDDPAEAILIDQRG